MNQDTLLFVALMVALVIFAARKEVVPAPAPVPGDGFRVLVLEETEERSKLPRPQYTALTSSAVRDYLDAKTAKGPDGSAEWQVWDDDLPTATMQPNWQAAFERAKQDSQGQRPWLIVSNGSTGESMALPANEADFLALLKKYGG